MTYGAAFGGRFVLTEAQLWSTRDVMEKGYSSITNFRVEILINLFKVSVIYVKETSRISLIVWQLWRKKKRHV